MKINSHSLNRFHHMCRTIGYILHNFKDPANPRAVILTDEVISDNPEGGVGKGVFLKGLGKIKNMVTMDGKSFNSFKVLLMATCNPIYANHSTGRCYALL